MDQSLPHNPSSQNQCMAVYLLALECILVSLYHKSQSTMVLWQVMDYERGSNLSKTAETFPKRIWSSMVACLQFKSIQKPTRCLQTANYALVILCPLYPWRNLFISFSLLHHLILFPMSYLHILHLSHKHHTLHSFILILLSQPNLIVKNPSKLLHAYFLKHSYIWNRCRNN